jgi:hypothetical protein
MGLNPKCCSGECTDVATDVINCGSCTTKVSNLRHLPKEKLILLTNILLSALETNQRVAWGFATISLPISIIVEHALLCLVKESSQHAALGSVLT